MILLLAMTHERSSTPRRQRLALSWLPRCGFAVRIQAACPFKRDGHPRFRQSSVVFKRRLRTGGWLAIICSTLVAVVVLSGCTSVGVHQQRLVSKKNMLFSESAVFSYSSKVLTQVESGAAATGGAQAAGCTSCR